MPAAEPTHPQTLSLTQRELSSRLTWLIQLRWVATAGFAAGTAWAFRYLGVWRPLKPVLVFLASLAAANLVFTVLNYWMRRTQPARWKNICFALLQIFCDLVLLTGAVHLTGGVRSVLVVFYMVHMVLASELLRRWLAIVVATVASLMLDVLVGLEAHGILAAHHVEGFTLGYYSHDIAQSMGMAVQTLFIYNLGFFATVYVASSVAKRLRRREGEIEAMNRALSRINDAKSEFLRMANHEMRAPLMALQGLLGMVAQAVGEGGDPQEAHRLLERAGERLRSLARLVDDLLAYGRLQAADFTPHRRPVDWAEIAARAVEAHLPVAQVRQIRLDLETSPCTVVADPEQIMTLTSNLIQNAVRYTPGGGCVRVRLRGEGHEAVLHVEDNGIGIDAESCPHLFDEFFRASNAREFEPAGTGLGLTMCKRIADHHQGSITVRSALGQGSTFTVRLPAAS